MVNLLSPTSLLTFDTCSLLSPDGELAVPDICAHHWYMFPPLTWWWTCCPWLLCSPLIHVGSSHLMGNLLSRLLCSPLIHVHSSHLMVNLLSQTSVLTCDTCLLLSPNGELPVPDFFAHLWYMFAPLTRWWTCCSRFLCSPLIHVRSSHLMVNLLSLTSLFTFDTCSLLSPDGELAVPDFVAHLWYMFSPLIWWWTCCPRLPCTPLIHVRSSHLMVNFLSTTYLLTFDSCSLLSPDGEIAVPDFFAHLWYMFSPLIWWWTCCPRLPCTPLIHVLSSHLMVNMLSPTSLLTSRACSVIRSASSLSSFLNMSLASYLERGKQLSSCSSFLFKKIFLT